MITTGNILTIGICLLLLILFRQLDKNNRSIERVRKYSEKLKGDLDQFFAENKNKLDESILSLSLEQTKAVATVNRLEAMQQAMILNEQEVEERIKQVAYIDEQLQNYNKSLDDLLQMTAIAEENLSRITKESEFADSLAKKLIQAQKQMDFISSEIPLLKDSFCKENEQALSQVSQDYTVQIKTLITEIEEKLLYAQTSTETFVQESEIKFHTLFDSSISKAQQKANSFEDSSFKALKEQALERLEQYKKTVEEKIEVLHDATKQKLSETQQLVKTFQKEWQSEAHDFLETTRGEIKDLTLYVDDASAKLTESLSVTEKHVNNQADSLRSQMNTVQSELEIGLDTYKKDIEYNLSQLTTHITDAERLEENLRKQMSETENRVLGEFSVYTREQQERLAEYEVKMAERTLVLSEEMLKLETNLQDLKEKAYDNVSKNLKVFEDDFFADLKKRGDAINFELVKWQETVENKLTSIAFEEEGKRKDIESKYELELQSRLSQIGDMSRESLIKLEEQIGQVESSLRNRIATSEESIASFIAQYKVEFETAQNTASKFFKSEFDIHTNELLELLRKQQKEVEDKERILVDSIELAKNQAEDHIETLKINLNSWQAKNNQQYSAAQEWLQEQIESLSKNSTHSIANITQSWENQFIDFQESSKKDRSLLKEEIDEMKASIVHTKEALNTQSITIIDSFEHQSKHILKNFDSQWREIASTVQERLESKTNEIEKQIETFKPAVAELKDRLDEHKEKTFNKINQDVNQLAENLNQIDIKQNQFIAQTKIFERADQLKLGLENDIEKLKNEVSILENFKESMNTLEGHYSKVRKLEEEANGKLSRFTQEKKRIDILETDFTKLLNLSDSIDKKINELSSANDDLQQYQVMFRRFEETMADLNTRYERMEKKAQVLDGTVEGIDTAFEQLKDLESTIQTYKNQIVEVPKEITRISAVLNKMLESEKKTLLVVERLESLDDILEDVEARTEKMEVARQWLARTETRLDEIARKAEDQLKLLADLLKDDAVGKKAKGAPPIGIRENVIKLKQSGWKVDEIARAMQLSRGEVELILEMPQK